MPLWIVCCETTLFKWMEKILLYLFFFNQSVFEWVCFALQQIPRFILWHKSLFRHVTEAATSRKHWGGQAKPLVNAEGQSTSFINTQLPPASEASTVDALKGQLEWVRMRHVDVDQTWEPCKQRSCFMCYTSPNETCCASTWHTGVQCCQPFKSTLMNLAQSKKEPRDKSSDFLSRLSHAQYGSLCLMGRRVEKSETVDSPPVCKAWSCLHKFTFPQISHWSALFPKTNHRSALLQTANHRSALLRTANH